MSWFDATGIASLAKTALKEAQKTIDKALDIIDDDNNGDSTKATTSISDLSAKSSEIVTPDSIPSDNSDPKMMKQSISNPILSTTGTSASNLWGSFSGSFFDPANVNDEKAKAAVTVAPTGTSELRMIAKKEEKNPANNSGRTSSASASESVEILSSPMTPSSGLTSPSASKKFIPIAIKTIVFIFETKKNISFLDFQPISSSSCTTLQFSKTPSESIEVIGIGCAGDETPISSDLITPDSVISTTAALTSTSCTSISDSVEVIDGNQITFNKHPTRSSSIEEMPTSHLDDDDEDESVSISYNTVSESAAAVTVLDASSNSTQKPITTPPSRTTLSLPLAQAHHSITGKHTKEHSPSGSLILDTNKIKPTSISYSEKSLENFEVQAELSDSTQSFEDVQQILLDEAAKNRQKTVNQNQRDGLQSPQSPDDKSDLVKVSLTTAEHNSDHTSADEVETATSSDIEIISGPNGDSSSTNSIAGIAACKPSPLKTTHAAQSSGHSPYVIYSSGNIGTKKKGHYRELSGASTYSMQSESGSDGCSHSVSEIEKLMNRITELSEVIEVREFKLVQLGRENAELYEKNSELKHQLNGLQLRSDTQEINSIAEEYTQRVSALERKFQQTLRERDNLRTELKSIQTSLSKSVSNDDVDRLVKEKDVMIEELKLEGEKLSKQILQHSNIIKKLRAKEKESDAQLKRQNEQIDELTTELERSKKSLSAKDEVERSQMEAIHKLTSEKQKLTKELAHTKSELDDTIQKLKTMQTSFDAAKKELTEKQQQHVSLTRKAKDLTNLQSEQQTLQQQNQQMAHELETMREKLKLSTVEQTGQHRKLRQENAKLLQRLEEVEQRSEEQAHAITEATIPLVRQCEALQSTLNTRTLAYEKQETIFLKKIEILEKELANVSVVERTTIEQTEQLKSRIQSLEESLSKALLRLEQSATALQQKQMDFELLQNDFQKTQFSDAEAMRKHEKTIDELNSKVVELQLELKATRLERKQRSPDARKTSTVEFAGTIQHEIENRARDGNESNDDRLRELNRYDENSSPTLSVGRMSAADSLASNVWHLVNLSIKFCSFFVFHFILDLIVLYRMTLIQYQMLVVVLVVYQSVVHSTDQRR